MQLLKSKMPQAFPVTLSKSRPDPKFLKRFTLRIQSNSKKLVIGWIQSNPSQFNARLCQQTEKRLRTASRFTDLRIVRFSHQQIE